MMDLKDEISKILVNVLGMNSTVSDHRMLMDSAGNLTALWIKICPTNEQSKIILDKLGKLMIKRSKE